MGFQEIWVSLVSCNNGEHKFVLSIPRFGI